LGALVDNDVFGPETHACSGFASRGTVHTCYCRRRHETGEVKEWMPLEAKLTGYRVVATLLFVTALLLFS